MSPPLTGHRDDCSGAQRASWHPVLSLLSQSLSHPSLPFCLLLRQALMHAYIIGLGKAWGAGTGQVGEGGWWCSQNSQEIFRRKHSERITDSFLRYTRGFLQTYFIYCLLNWEICSKSSTQSGLACSPWVISTRSWHNLVECEIILHRKCFDCHLLTFLHWHIFAFVVYLSTGEWVLTPIPEHWPGRRKA